MKKRIGMILIAGVLLAGCGSRNNDYASYNMVQANIAYTDNASVGIASKSNESYMDYGNAYISGDMADYSYCFSAQGAVKKKEDVLNEFDSIQSFVDEHDGYIENLRNDYTGYDIDWSDDYFSPYEIDYIATGCVSFTVQIDNENVPELIEELSNYADRYGLTVTRYDQHITNYEAYEIVDDDEYYYGYQTITEEELEKWLKYASLDVSISYRIKRNGFTGFLLSAKNFWGDVENIFKQVIALFLIFAAAGYILIFVAVLPMYKIIKKSLYKYRLKHDEYYLPKKVIVTDEKEQ